MKYLKIVLQFLTISLFVFAGTQEVLAEQEFVIQRVEWNADENISTFEEDFLFPKNLFILNVNYRGEALDSELALKEIYYFFATRSDYGDLPFHYIVDWEGNIYEGNNYGGEAKIKIGGEQETIFVAYINNGKEDFSVLSLESIKKICLFLINEYTISPANVGIKQFEYGFKNRDDIQEPALSASSESFSKTYQLISKHLGQNYSPKEKSFSVKVTDLSYEKDPLVIGEETDINIKIENTGDYNIYGSDLFNLFVVRDKPFDERSSFYNSSEWESPSRVSILEEGQKLLVGQEKDFSFKVKVPLFPPAKEENFVILDSNGKTMDGTDFKIRINIKKGDNSLIEITETPVGYLNVRKTPGLGEIITKVTPGERFIILESQPGHFKIEANGQEGWISSSYAATIE